jgi:glycosyltransferase involved in cell wall biosynthesis
MKTKKKILFIQHASQFGGSAMSLLYTLQEIKNVADDQYEIIIALAKWTQQLSDFYEEQGFKVIKPKFIDTYEHTQSVNFKLWNPIDLFKEIVQQIKLRKAVRNTEQLIDLVKPDLVHLNSVVLQGCALADKRKKIPLIWHIREPSVRGLIGLRRHVLKKRLKNLPDKVFFICKADMQSWGNPPNGKVVYNFVDFNKFNKEMPAPKSIEGIVLPKGDLNILFLGAVGRVKGGLYLIRAINNLMKKYPDKKINFLFPGGEYDTPTYLLYKAVSFILPMFGQGTYAQKIEKEINKSSHPESFIKFRFVKAVPLLFAASDVLVFPSIRPHFARPIIEAGAMAKPVIGSRLGGVEELIEEGKNGFFVNPKNVNEIEERLEYFLNNKNEVNRMGQEGYNIALNKFQAKKNILIIIDVYKTLI